MSTPASYHDLQTGIVGVLESARASAIRSVNALMTAAYWEIGQRIVESEQGGEERAGYGEGLILRLAKDLTHRFGRGFFPRNLEQMRLFYLGWSIPQTPSAESQSLATLATRFPLPWSAYVRLLSVRNPDARAFYEAEALRCGWSVRQLDRQINSQFYERAALSRNKAALLEQGSQADDGDLKVGRFTHADAGQMHLYLNYATEHWMREGENPPVGLILCAAKGAEEAHYALDNLPNKVMAAEYQMLLPDEKRLTEELERTRRKLESRRLRTLATASPEPK